MSELAILIDCWPDQEESVIDNIVSYCLNNTAVTAIAVAGYSITPGLDVHRLEDWQLNSEQWFTKETKWDLLRKSYQSTKWNYTEGVHAKIVNMKTRADQIKFIAWQDYQIMYYCHYINPGITKISFFGFSWDICVKYRPVGWLSIAALQYHGLLNSKIDLCVDNRCVYDVDKRSLPNPSCPWYLLDDHTYKLDIDKIIW